MKKMYLLFFFITFSASLITAQTSEISAERMAVFTVPDSGAVADSLLPYNGDLGVRRVIVADPDGDGVQEIIATDYTNGGRVHVMEVVGDSVLEIVWSSPASWNASGSGSTPRFPQVGDCDGDGKPEIIFEQRYYDNGDDAPGRIAFYEFNGTDWGTTPGLVITPTSLAAIGGREGLRFHREVLTVYDFDGDGKSEIIPHGDSPRQDVLILGVNGDIGGFPSVYIEGGKPGEQLNGGDWGSGGSFWNSEPADIDGDGNLEIINHTWNNYGFWSIDVEGPNSYTYPDAIDNADAKAKGAYQEYGTADAVSYFGARAADVNGDGRDEIVGTMYGQSHNISLFSFDATDNGVYIWDTLSSTENYAVIIPKTDVAALAGKSNTELWPIVKGDLNKDGKDELYTGGGTGLNLVAIQYNGTGSLLERASYDMNLVYDGAGGEVFADISYYNGRATLSGIDTLYEGTDSVQYDSTYSVDLSIVDTVYGDQPFTSYIFADSVDLDGDGNLEIVLSEQSVTDSVNINYYDWDPVTEGHKINEETSYKIFNEYRQTVRVLEYNGSVVGFKDQTYSIVSPDDYKLEQNYPNPFNPSTTINFALPVDKKISLKIYNMLGQEVVTLVNNQSLKKGNHQLVWNGTNNAGAKVSSGHYIAKLEYGNFIKSIKMTLLK